MLASIRCRLRNGAIMLIIIFVSIAPVIAVVSVRLRLHPSFGLCSVDICVEIDRLSSTR